MEMILLKKIKIVTVVTMAPSGKIGAKNKIIKGHNARHQAHTV